MWSNGDVQPEISGSTAPDCSGDMQALIDEMRVQDFDSIRFATYRAACKLRFIQKKTNVHLVDIWNMIESFRENGLNAMPIHTQIKTSRIELLLTTIYHNLNKRLVSSQHIDTDKSISLLLSFLLGTYDKQQTGRLTVFSIKIALATICAGKLVDKLRYMFSQISDSSGFLEYDRFTDFMQQVLALTTAVFEAPTFGFSEAAVSQCFVKDQRVTLNNFLDVFMSDPCPPCVMWLPLLHRMASVEHVYHPVVCDACQVRSFTGFRYKCQRCSNYQLCQNCFWRGRTSQNHSNEHEMKEYSSYKSPTKQLAHSIHKSLQCIPTTNTKQPPLFAERPQRPLELQNIVPATPTTLRRAPPDPITDWPSSPILLPGQVSNGGALDDEHKLIARYSAKLSGRADYPLGNGRERSMTHAVDERSLIARLEEENSHMMREISRLESQSLSEDGQLTGLRERKSQLEEKMFVMQQKRRDLMMQLEQLMTQLNAPGAAPFPSASMSQIPDSLSGVNTKVSNAFRTGSLSATSLQGDLLHAADQITSNMGEFLRELDQAQAQAQTQESSATNGQYMI
ncbi:Dystrobrevin [Trichostrongylus colubriformis]|uniref:Dystrobrevin n=1 Tax=Trichostrongylus colubriformis TaxID=6319 RepID=A0AAN8F1V3_TRICO